MVSLVVNKVDVLIAPGGSIRVPCAFNFLYGIRPSNGRLPYAKMANSMMGQETIESVVGPMAHSAAGQLGSFEALNVRTTLTVSPDLRLFLTSMLDGEPWKYDSKVVPMPWNTSEEDVIKSKLQSGGLTLGFFDCDDNVSIQHNPPH